MKVPKGDPLCSGYSGSQELAMGGAPVGAIMPTPGKSHNLRDIPCVYFRGVDVDFFATFPASSTYVLHPS